MVLMAESSLMALILNWSRGRDAFTDTKLGSSFLGNIKIV